MTSRRSFLGGILAAGLSPSPSWADVGAPHYIAGFRDADGRFGIGGLSAIGKLAFTIPTPARGHAAAAHPIRPHAVAFARRPGRFAMVIDCRDGNILTEIEAPDQRHFYGHGTFSADGSKLFTTENDYENGAGIVGVWDVESGYLRQAEFSSGGIGPHDIKQLLGQGTLVIANGGIDTHPESGRTKLNLASMRPNLCYVSTSGEILSTVTLPKEYSRNSIRHLDVRRDDLVAFAMQWQGDSNSHPPLLGTHQINATVSLFEAAPALHQQMMNYVGSVTFLANGSQIAISSPRGNQVQIFATNTGAYLSTHNANDVSGIAGAGAGLMLTTGGGLTMRLTGSKTTNQFEHGLSWDNHLIRII